MVFFVDKLETSHERKTGGTSKKEESHDVAPGRNRGKGQKNVDFSSIKWLRSLSGWETVEVLLLVEVAPGQACGEVSVMAEVAPRPACRGGLGDDGPDRSWAEL
ncbi:unnamed protein product [Sphagnum jensenii]